MSRTTEDIKRGDRVTFTKAYREQVHDDPRHLNPVWVDQVYTVADVWPDEWLFTIQTKDGRETRRAGRPMLTKLYDPDIEKLL